MSIEKRPVNLDLKTMHFPLPAIVSILHRISGVTLFFFIPFLLYILQTSLKSADSFLQLQECLKSPVSKVFILGLLAAFVYHFFAGMRHIIMDMGFGENLSTMRASAKAVLIIAILTTVILAGVWVW